MAKCDDIYISKSRVGDYTLIGITPNGDEVTLAEYKTEREAVNIFSFIALAIQEEMKIYKIPSLKNPEYPDAYVSEDLDVFDNIGRIPVRLP